MSGLWLIASGHTPALRGAVFGGDDDLDEGGRSAALALRGTPRLLPRSFPHGRLLVAPSRAARQTAETLSPGTPVTEEPALAEPDYGTWTGRAVDQVAPAELQRWLTDPTAAPHGGQSLADVQDRAQAWLGGHTTGKLTVVAHPIVVRALIAAALGLPADGVRRLAVGPLSITRLSHHTHWSLFLTSP